MMAITALLSIGIKESTRVNNVMVAIKVIVVLLVVAVGVFHVTPANWHPFMPNGWSGVFGAAAIMFFAFIGFDSVSSAAEEVKNPRRDLPIGIISSLAVCAVLYVAVAAVVTGIVPAARLCRGLASGVVCLAGRGRKVGGGVHRPGRRARHADRDPGHELRPDPHHLRDVARWPASRAALDGSPEIRDAVLHDLARGLFFGLIGALVPLNVLAELINIGTLAAFSMVSVAVLILRKTHPDLPRAFRCPGVPVVPLLAVASCLFLMLNLKRFTWIAFGVWLVIGLLIYFGYSRRHSKLGQGIQ